MKVRTQLTRERGHLTHSRKGGGARRGVARVRPELRAEVYKMEHLKKKAFTKGGGGGGGTHLLLDLVT